MLPPCQNPLLFLLDRVKKIYINNNAPINDVTTPMGSSPGLSIVLDSRSVSIRKLPPNNTERGISFL